MDDATQTQVPPASATLLRAPRRVGLRGLFARAADEAGPADPGRAPESTRAWLHVLVGGAPEGVTRGTMELAARFLARGERVILVDADPRAELHRCFARESRWGVVECLTGSMPVLGLVQDTGRLGLYLLAHGTPARRVHWPQMGRLLDEARPHFGRAVLALGPDASGAIGAALEGWHLEAWWVAGSGAPRHRDAVARRLGLHLHPLDTTAMPRASLDRLDARIWQLAAGADAGPALAADTAPASAGEDEARPEPTVALAAGLPGPSSPAPILECDSEVRNRLRFLLWMRRLHSERSPRVTAQP